MSKDIYRYILDAYRQYLSESDKYRQFMNEINSLNKNGLLPEKFQNYFEPTQDDVAKSRSLKSSCAFYAIF